MKIFKKTFLPLLILFLAKTAFSIPAVVPSIPDFSGQFVFYKDSSFERESYIGVVYYDENTYGFRYYAPAVTAKKNPKPEKNIHILFTIDSKKENLELTGERILSTVMPEDTDLINYIHDFFYEMTKRRQNAGELSSQKAEYQNYEQFGGNVTIHFDPLIPIFNLEKIVSADKKAILQIVTVGQLVSSEDKSFEKFIGFNKKIIDKKRRFKKDKNARPVEVSYKENVNSIELKARLDSSWNSAAENIYTLNNVAIFTVNQISVLSENQIPIMKCRLLIGNELVYPNWQNQKIEQKSAGTLVTQISYHAAPNSYSYTFKFIREIDSKTIGLHTLTVFADAYESNKKYFDEIVASFY